MNLIYYFYRYIWPFFRWIVKGQLSKRCSICTLNEHCVSITGHVCEVCRKTAPSPILSENTASLNPEAEKQLDDLLINAQGRGGRLYDVLFLFSGGKDSTYILNRLKKNYNHLRILALTVDNGFRSSVGKQNTEMICEYLNVDHLEIRPYQVFRKLYRYGFEHLSYRGFVCTDFWEGELFQDIGRNLAAQMEIPLLMLGYTPEQLSYDYLPVGFDEYQLYGHSGFEFKDNQHFTREKFLDFRLEGIFTPEEMNYWWDASKWPVERIPTMVFPFQAWGYHKMDVVNEIGSSLKIILNKRALNSMLTNDIYVGLGFYLDYRIFGYSTMIEEEFAQHVRFGREDYRQNRNLWEAMEYLFLNQESLVLRSREIRSCLRKLDLKQPMLDRIIQTSREQIRKKIEPVQVRTL
jgi:hypothetical protein